MHDLLLALLWSALVTAGLAGAVLLGRRGVAAARVRDLLHVGAGVWVFGWPAWERPWVAVTVPWAAVAALAALPLLDSRRPGGRAPAPRRPPAARVVSAVTSDDERWAGLVLYALAFALLTTVALGTPMSPDPAAVALLALAWGDGVGGAVGSRFGRRTYHLPWTKRKSWLGSAAVAAGTVAGVLAWTAWTGSAARHDHGPPRGRRRRGRDPPGHGQPGGPGGGLRVARGPRLRWPGGPRRPPPARVTSVGRPTPAVYVKEARA